MNNTHEPNDEGLTISDEKLARGEDERRKAINIVLETSGAAIDAALTDGPTAKRKPGERTTLVHGPQSLR